VSVSVRSKQRLSASFATPAAPRNSRITLINEITNSVQNNC
jgi:hypothetical protein